FRSQRDGVAAGPRRRGAAGDLRRRRPRPLVRVALRARRLPLPAVAADGGRGPRLTRPRRPPPGARHAAGGADAPGQRPLRRPALEHTPLHRALVPPLSSGTASEAPADFGRRPFERPSRLRLERALSRRGLKSGRRARRLVPLHRIAYPVTELLLIWLIALVLAGGLMVPSVLRRQIGRASCRESVSR